MTAKVYQFEFPGSGLVATVRGVSMTMITNDVRRSVPRPKPPTQRVNYGTDTDPDWREESNSADPAYQDAMTAWDEEVSIKSLNLTIALALSPHHLSDEDKELVASVRQGMAEAGVDLSAESDKMVWFRYVGCGSDTDWKDFMAFVRGVGEPSGVDAVREGFRR